MNIDIEFKEKAEPCTEKPLGCYEKIKEGLYVETWMGWEVNLADTRFPKGLAYDNEWSLMTQRYQCKPTERQLRKLKKLMWKCPVRKEGNKKVFDLLLTGGME